MMKIQKAKPEHAATYADLTALITKHAAGLTPIEILAIAANIVGKLVAMQDQRTVSRELALETVMQNIEQGNREAIEQILNPMGSA